MKDDISTSSSSAKTSAGTRGSERGAAKVGVAGAVFIAWAPSESSSGGKR